ncbi:MAG TPA: hypothetical protein VGC49_04800, partial [Solirubrobacterales bacterium]
MNLTRRLSAKALMAAVGCLAAAVLAAPAAQADFSISDLENSTSIDGKFTRQAGSHPDFASGMTFNGSAAPGSIRVDLPAGLVGNPTAAPQCTFNELGLGKGGASKCRLDSQIGVVKIWTRPNEPEEKPLYNMALPGTLPGLFAFNYIGALVAIEPRVRASDYGISAVVSPVSQAVPLLQTVVTIWGVPADPIHDNQRYKDGEVGFPSPAAARTAFMTSPTSCPAAPSLFSAEAESWEEPGVVSALSSDLDPNGTPFQWEGCERLPFRPSITISPGTFRAASPAGLDVDIKVPQSNDAYGLASAHVKRTVVTLPKGMTVSPSAVAGLGACSPAQIKLGSNEAPTCPDSAKIGNATIDTPLLATPLEGEVILAKQNENPFHSLFAIYIVAKGPGFYLKLPGELNVDKQTGQLKTIFDNTPQQPFSELHLDFRGGPTAPLVTPNTCGTYNAHTEITSWASDIPVSFDTPMTIDENCAAKGGFNPSLQAGVASPVAGANSPLTIRIRRQDGEQNISRLDVTLPEGELAKLKGVEVCPDALAATGNCGKGSQVGISTTAIGTGAFPLFVPQPGKDPTALYLGGPYKGAPYSLITKVPAQSGPFDFGMIVVRTAINVDPVTSQVIAKSDPLPQILEGVPIAYRDVRIEVQKPDFTVNPTSCEQRYVTTTISSIEGGTAHPSVPFKVGDCASLGFGPKLAFKVKGGTNRGDYQALTATLTTHKHEANISRVAVTLPHSEFLAQEHIRTICTRVQFAAKNCPQGSIYGFAKATTPLLDKPLEGPVYLRSSSNPLPDLVATMNGQ